MRILAAALLISTLNPSGVPAQQTLRLPSREGFVQVEDSVRLFYKILGTGRDTVVVLHGGPGFHMNYMVPDLVPLAAHHTLLFFDQRNAGRSTLFADTARANVRLLVRDLERLRQHFRIRRLTLFGHSWGGRLAGMYAAEYPDRVAQMVLVASSPPPGVAINFNPMARIDSVANAARLANLRAWREGPADSTKACWDYYAIFARGYFRTPVHARRMWGDLCNVPQAAMLSSTRGYPQQSVVTSDVREALRRVQAPVLVIHGDDDPIPRSAAEAWVSMLPRARLVTLSDAGHFPWIDRPAPFFASLDRFLTGGWPDSSSLNARGAAFVKPADRTGSPYLSARAQVTDVENQIMDAVARADWDSLGRVYPADGVIMPPAGPPVIGRQAIVSFWRVLHKRGMRSMELQPIDFEGSGALLNVTGKYVIRDSANAMLDVGKFVAMYRREGGRWRLLRDMFNTSLETRSPLEVPDYLPPSPR